MEIEKIKERIAFFVILLTQTNIIANIKNEEQISASNI